MSFETEFMMRHSSNKYYIEPDEIRLPMAFKEEYLRHFRWVMVRRLKNLLEKKKKDFRNEVESFIFQKH